MKRVRMTLFHPPHGKRVNRQDHNGSQEIPQHHSQHAPHQDPISHRRPRGWIVYSVLTAPLNPWVLFRKIPESPMEKSVKRVFQAVRSRHFSWFLPHHDPKTGSPAKALGCWGPGGHSKRPAAGSPSDPYRTPESEDRRFDPHLANQNRKTQRWKCALSIPLRGWPSPAIESILDASIFTVSQNLAR